MINIYSLYKKQHEKQKIRISIYEKVLKKCHKRIKYVANIGKQETYFIVPEYMFGVPLYKQIACVCFLMIKLRKNGFNVKYTHPNFIYISWKHYNDEAQYNYTLNIPQIEFNNPESNAIRYQDNDLEIRRLPTTTIKKKNINHYKNLNDKLISDIDLDLELSDIESSIDRNLSDKNLSNISFKSKNERRSSIQSQEKKTVGRHESILEQLNRTAKFLENN
jgi:hypothetical protein